MRQGHVQTLLLPDLRGIWYVCRICLQTAKQPLEGPCKRHMSVSSLSYHAGIGHLNIAKFVAAPSRPTVLVLKLQTSDLACSMIFMCPGKQLSAAGFKGPMQCRLPAGHCLLLLLGAGHPELHPLALLAVLHWGVQFCAVQAIHDVASSSKATVMMDIQLQGRTGPTKVWQCHADHDEDAPEPWFCPICRRPQGHLPLIMPHVLPVRSLAFCRTALESPEPPPPIPLPPPHTLPAFPGHAPSDHDEDAPEP